MYAVAAILLTAHPVHDRPDSAALSKVDGRESALRAVELVTNRDSIKQILLVVDPAAAEEVKRKLGSHLMFMGTKLVQAAGDWYAQLAGAAEKVDKSITHILVHDAARPAVPYTDLEALLATDAPATALALPVRGPLAKATVPGPGVVETMYVASVITPRVYERAVFERMCTSGVEPSPLALIEGSPLNVRCGEVSAAVVKAMVQLLPKPKVVAPSSPFEEAQW